ncbi:hypothetical protein Mapa_010989 [Marchantia paleacea]|nr:hypothetical protein Mapa_010989 [Marchantia paleacea]
MVAADSSSSTPAATLRHEPQEQPEKGVSSASNGNGTVRKAKNREITSRYKAATTASTAAAAAATAAAQAAAAARRHPSPNLGRSMSGDPPLPKRALSAERRRPWPSIAPVTPPEPKAVVASTPSPSDGVWPGVKPRAASRPEGLWPSSHPSKIPEGPNGNVEIRSGEHGDEAKTPDHTLKPAANGVHRGADSSTGGPPPRKGSPMRRQSTDQSENSRPIEHMRSKPDLQRWPGSSNGKVFGGAAAMTRSMDLSGERERSLSNRSNAIMSQGRPGTSSASRAVRPSTSSLINSARSFSRSINEGPVGPASRPNSRNNTPERTGRTRVAPAPVPVPAPAHGHARSPPPPPPPPPPPAPAPVPVAKSAVQELSNLGAENGSLGDNAGHVRHSSQETVLAGSDTQSTLGENASDSESVSSGGSGTTGSRTSSSTRGTTVPSRVWQAAEARSRRLSEGDRMRSSMSEQDLAAALKAGRRKVPTLGFPIANGSSNSAWSLSSGRAITPISSSPQPPVSPSARGGRGGSSPLRGLPSPTRSRPPTANGSVASRTSSISSSIISGTDLRLRGKKAMSQQEEALFLRILHNRFLQWRFINARADAALSSQKAAAEKSLYSVWLRTSELRASVAMQRIKLQQAKHFYKLSTILSNQAPLLQDWSSLKQEHSTALSGVIEALEASILRVPVTGGARADVQAVKEALGSAVDVMNAVELSVKTLLPKAQSMDVLVAKLAETAAQERALLADCGDLLSTAASLEIEERSLSTHLVQLQHEKNRLLATSMDSGMAASDFVRLSSP